MVTEVFLGGTDPLSGLNRFLGQILGFQCISVIATFNCLILERDLPAGTIRIKLIKPDLQRAGDPLRSMNQSQPHTPKKGWKVIEEYPIGGGKTVDLTWSEGQSYP